LAIIQARRARFYLEEILLLPLNPPMPNTKPNVYQPPLLFTAHTAISSLNKLPINEIGAIIPCHNPPQNPY
jgi:hypothetical protein